MNTHVKVLEDNYWICKCADPWVSLLLLATKPHQKECQNIKEFIWRLCVNDISLISITRCFEFPVIYCTNSIDDFGNSSGPIYFSSLDASSEYH